MFFAHSRLCPALFARRAEPADLHRGSFELLPHLRALGLGQRDLHAMLVRRPELDGIKPDLRQVLDDRRDVPVLRDVVRNGAELQTAPRGRRPRRLCVGRISSSGTTATVRESRVDSLEKIHENSFSARVNQPNRLVLPLARHRYRTPADSNIVLDGHRGELGRPAHSSVPGGRRSAGVIESRSPNVVISRPRLGLY